MIWNLGQTSAWFCLAKGKKYIEQLWQIHVSTLKNVKQHCQSKTMYQFLQIHVCNNFEKYFDKSNNLNKNQLEHGVSDWLTDKARQWSDLGPIKKIVTNDTKNGILREYNGKNPKIYRVSQKKSTIKG